MGAFQGGQGVRHRANPYGNGAEVPEKIAGVVLYDLDEVAKILNVHRRTIQNYINGVGKGPRLRAVKVKGRWLVSKERLTAFLNAEE